MIYYNEFEPFAVEWLKNLSSAGHINPGTVDSRSIREVSHGDVAGATQAHFFAGIGVWSHALRLAGWPDDRPVWTGSCPCQPFSVAGRGRGVEDERHLWPDWFRLIRECRPPVVFGEQVSSPDTLGRVPAGASKKKPRKGRRVSAEVSQEQSSGGPDPAREEEGRGKGSPVRLGPAQGRHPEEDLARLLRGHWAAVQSGWREDLGQPLAGPGDAEDGLPAQEHQSGAALSEQRDGRLGRTEAGGTGAGDSEDARATLSRAISEAGGATPKSDGRAWIDLVRSDLESIGYAVGIAVLPAAGVGAPHIRQRLYFVGIRLADDGREGRRQVGPDTRGRDEGGRTTRVDKRSLHGGAFSTRGLADASDERFDGRRAGQASDGRDETRLEPERLRDARGLGHADGEHAGRDTGAGHRTKGGARLRGGGDESGASSAVGQRLGEPIRQGLEGHSGHGDDRHQPGRDGAQPHGPTPTSGFWSNPDWVACRDGKQRPVEPGSFPLAHGASARVGRLRAYGNAIVSEVAATFIKAVMEHLND